MNSTVSISFSFLKSVVTKNDVRMDEREKERNSNLVCLHSLLPFLSVVSSWKTAHGQELACLFECHHR